MTMPSWSHTALTNFENCPKKFYHLRVAKDVTDTPGEAALWGQRVHTFLENRVRDGTPLPPELQEYESIVQKIMPSDDNVEVLIEKQLAINRAFQPCAWDAEDVWCRGIVDFGLLKPGKALLLDWKTGKRKQDNDQLQLFALLGFAHYPHVNFISTGFIWLKESKIDVNHFDRKEIPTLWQTFLPRVSRMERAYENNEWPVKPSGLCRAWCPVISCQYNGKKR